MPGMKYAALSYCWGNEEQPKSTPENLKEWTKCISLKEISAVTKDAIQLYIALSIRYLWIDALCILQG